jgi:type II secretory pathway pseudopilin PulG
MKTLISRVISLAFCSTAFWATATEGGGGGGRAVPSVRANPEFLFPEVAYEATVTDEEARFQVELTAECLGKQGGSQALFEGDLAVLPPKLPTWLRLELSGNQYRLVAERAGRYHFKVELVAKVTLAEPWNQVAFRGPEAAIASITAQASGPGVELQLLSGTVLNSAPTNGIERVKGFLGADPIVALRWSHAGGPTEVARKAVLTAETTVNAQLTPTVVKYVTQIGFDILQGKVSKLTIALPGAQALTRLAGEQIRDWEIKPGTGANKGPNEQQLLEVQFVKPLERQCQLTLFSEQSVEAAASVTALVPPQPLATERESGSFIVGTEDTLAEVETAAGLRQVNAPAGAMAAYRFTGRPFTLSLRLKRIEPVISVTERVSARVEETRLISSHALALNVEKAGLYGLELLPGPGWQVADVRGEGVEDWKLSESAGKRVLRINFGSRVLGMRKLEVQLEQALKTFPDHIILMPLRVAGAVKEQSEIGAAAAAGIRLKTSELVGLREVPIRVLSSRSGTPGGPEEALGYRGEQADWRLSLATERLAARVVAEIFNLITIGDGIVGGSATIRYGLINQGVQEFELSVPAFWKNVEFTGPNIRRKELKANGNWTIGLQDKAWGGYTLVVTYDYQFDPKGAVLGMGGIHCVSVERETGSLALTTAASLKLEPKTKSDSLRPVDELELSAADRGLITRSVLLAYQYSESPYQLEVDVKRFSEASVLSAVADRTQLTTVLTDAGQMLTQASFMVKNNDKQFQRFRLPKGAKFWSCHVNGQPVKAEKDGEWLMAPLPRDANRDRAFGVDIVYAEKKGVKPALLPQAFALEAPQTDVPNTYAEWQLYAPAVFRLSSFAGNMTPVGGTTYDLGDAWQKFTRFYWDFLREAGGGLLLAGTLVVLMVALVGSAIRRGWGGVITVLVTFGIIVILAGMLLPALSRAKARAQRISAVNSLKQIGLAARTFALDNNDRLPNSFEEMINELSTDKVTYDPESGQRFVYLGAGHDLQKIQPDSVIAYSPTETGHYRAVLFADGSVQQMSSERFAERSQRGWILPATGEQVAQNQQLAAVRGAQFQPATVQPLNATPAAAANQAVAPQERLPGAPPAAPRIRSIHIDIPREGQAFTFTKVLNLSREPLAVQVKIMKLQTFQTAQMLLQVGTFVTGLLVWWWQWRKSRNSFVLTLALALALGGVGSLLLAWRLLHLALIWAAPMLLLAVIGWLTWKFWPRPAVKTVLTGPGLEPGLPPALATIVFLSWSLAASVAEPVVVAPAISVRSASYTGTVSEAVAQIDAMFQIITTEPGQQLHLFGADVAVEQFSAKPGEAKLVREGNSVAVVLPRRGESTLRFKLLVKLGGEVTKRQLAFAIPSALTTRLALTIDQPDADVEFPSAISIKRTTANQQTRLDALLGAGDRVELFWTPRVKRAAEIAANVICQNATLVTFGGGVLNARARMEYQVTQGEMRQARVRLPAGQRLLRVEGELIRTWEVKTTGADSVLVVDLLKGVAPNYALTIETEKVLETLPALVKAEIPHALEVKRETGLVAVRGDEELEVGIEQAGELLRVDAEEFERLTGKKHAGTLNAFRFLKPDFVLESRVTPIQPQIEAVAHNHVRVGQEQITLTASIDYTIKRAGVFSLKLRLPAGYHLEEVIGTNILQWVEREETPGRVVEISLRQRTTGAYGLKLELSQTLKELPKTLSIVGVHPLAAAKLAGFVSISVEAGVAVKPEAFDGLTEVPASTLGTNDGSGNGPVLAYKFLATEPQATPAWKLSVQTEAMESWVRAEIVNTLTLADTWVSGRALARYEIQNAPVKELRLRIPATFRNVEISGQNIRRRDHEGEIWRLEFQSKIKGAQVITVTWEEPRPTNTNYVELHAIGADRVERETGLLAIVARPPLQVTERTAGELQRIDLQDLPEWAGHPDAATVLAYRYVRPGYKLGLEARRFAEADVLQALVEGVSLSTVVADDGQTMTQMSLSVRNQGQQHLEVTLPAGATVWSAFVSGQVVRPSLREGKLLLPLEHLVGDDAAIAIDLVYVGTNAFPQKRGTVELVSPRLDAPWKSARWEVFLPPDYHYSHFGGTMTREVETAMLEASSFSILDYSSQESKNKADLAKEMKTEISKAQRKLSSGNVKEALADYNRARAKGDLAATKDAEARQLEADLRRAQGSNLIQAQNAFSVSNSAQGQEPLSSSYLGQVIQYDNATAEAQWAKLQAAQDLARSTAQPIRVNLPTRGLRHAFTQVLQTEAGQAMSINLLAVNARGISWPQRLGGTVAGFLLLWGMVWLLTNYASAYRRHRAQTVSL